jgi:hypothetical protein
MTKQKTWIAATSAAMTDRGCANGASLRHDRTCSGHPRDASVLPTQGEKNSPRHREPRSGVAIQYHGLGSFVGVRPLAMTKQKTWMAVTSTAMT